MLQKNTQWWGAIKRPIRQPLGEHWAKHLVTKQVPTKVCFKGTGSPNNVFETLTTITLCSNQTSMHGFLTSLAIQDYLIGVIICMHLSLACPRFIEKVSFCLHHVATLFHIFTLGSPNTWVVHSRLIATIFDFFCHGSPHISPHNCCIDKNDHLCTPPMQQF